MAEQSGFKRNVGLFMAVMIGIGAMMGPASELRAAMPIAGGGYSFTNRMLPSPVAEEIQDPAKNLPRTLIGSVALVTLLYVIILLVIGGIFEQETIGEVRDPLTQAARSLAGSIIFAGLLATVSSANASIMASSRINLAMAWDRMVPNWLSAIHETLLTPHRAILLTGVQARMTDGPVLEAARPGSTNSPLPIIAPMLTVIVA